MNEMTIQEIQTKMESNELTAQSLTEMYLERIEKLDKQGPTLNAVIELNPDAITIANALDVEREAIGARGPLHGIPVMLKDNIDTGDRMRTSAGSLALANSIAARDSFVAFKLRQAGAVILGKTNLSEWANFRSTRSTSGWSSRGGQTRNPYTLDRNPCGSSSGSAAAAAANLCVAAIGTETDGSIVCPAHINSLVGIKPTVGLVGRSGIVPIAHSQDTAGPMTRTVADAAIILGALTGIDPRDTITKKSDGKSHTDYTQFLDPDGLRGARIGVARDYFGADDRVDRIIESCIQVIAALGAEIIDPAELKIDSEALGSAELEVLLTEFKADLNQYLERLGPDVPAHSLEELIDFNRQNEEQVMPYFGQERMLAAQEKGPLSGEMYMKALDDCRRITRTEGIDAAIEAHNLDAIVAPSGGSAWLTDWINGDHYGGSRPAPAAVAGYPNIT
ncbi:MAG: amidase, partial [Anaerolineales bacterium]|nr:amidase [Anaerolineales bacterium]